MKWLLPTCLALAVFALIGTRPTRAVSDKALPGVTAWEYGILYASADSLQENRWMTGKSILYGFDEKEKDGKDPRDLAALADLFQKMGGTPPHEGFSVLTVVDFLGSNGWELINANEARGVGNVTVTHFTFKRHAS